MENLFYVIVTVVALVILAIFLTVIGYTMTKGTTPGVFPPLANTCPDFWRTDPSANGVCIVPQYEGANTGTFQPSTATSSSPYGFRKDGELYKINFQDNGWGTLSGTSSICAKQNWAGLHGISWDGVSNYNGKC